MRKAQYRDKQAVVNLLFRAFEANPSVNYTVKQDHKRTQRIRRLLDYSFEICHAFGSIYVSADEKACALTLLPELKKTTIRTVFLDLRLVLTVIGTNRIRQILERETKIKGGYPKEPIYYLWFLGVDPPFQGKGIGGALLQELVHESQQIKRPIYLETSLPENVDLYQKHGFTVYDQLVFDHPLFCLHRKVG